MSKPHETEREARATVSHPRGRPGTGVWSAGNLRLLESAYHGPGVQIGAYAPGPWLR